MSASVPPLFNSQPTPEQELDQIDIDMQAAEQTAILAQSHYEKWQAVENAALIAIYDVWKNKEHRTDLLEPFCARHNIPWHGSFKNNRFLPVVKKMFPSRTPENHSEYSGVMAYAWEDKTPSQDLPGFIERKGGVQKAYRQYAAIKKARKNSKNVISALPAQAPFLDHVYNAFRLMQMLTYKGSASSDGELKNARSFVLRNQTSRAGQLEGVIETASTAYTAPAARMTLDGPIEELQGIAYLLEDSDAQTFVELYPQQQGWVVTADVGGMAFQCASGIKIKAIAIGPQHLGLRVLDRFRERTDYLTAELSQIVGFANWYKDTIDRTRGEWVRLKPSPSPNITPFAAEVFYAVHANAFRTPIVPRALDFNVHYDHVTIGFNRNRLRYENSAMLYQVHDMFSTAKPINILRDRRLLVTHATMLFRCLASEGTDAIFYLANTDEDQGAFVCELPCEAGQLVTAYPTVLSADMDLRCILDDLDIASVANTGVVIPISTKTAPPLPGLPLRHKFAEEVSRQFGGFVTCFRPQDEAKWRKRRDAFARQLTAWMNNTEVHLHLRLSGWCQTDIDAFEADFGGLLAQVEEFDGSYKAEPGALLIHNRIGCLRAFYASDYDWGIMMDDDAVLYDKAQHNSAWKLFPEMAKNGLAAYAEVDVFFPNNPGKPGGGFNAKYAEDPALYAGNHVFERDPDLKGSMFVVRNFRKAKRHEVLPDPSYTIHGEDTLFATEAIKQGCTVMKCWNINLKELVGERDSHFGGGRFKAMRNAHMRIAEMYGNEGLRMKLPDDESSKTLERKDFYANCWKARPTKWSTPKP